MYPICFIESSEGVRWVIKMRWGRIVSKRVYKYKYDALFYRRAYLHALRGVSKRFSGDKGYVSQGKRVKTSHRLSEELGL